MTLGIDGWRIHGKTGVPRYIVNVVQRWTRQLVGGRFDEVNLYTPRPVDQTQVPLPETIHETILKPDWRMLIWENLRLGPKCGDDVLWCPAYTSPLRTDSKVVVTTHDAAQSLYPSLYSFTARTFYAALYGRSARRAALVLTHNETTRHDIARCYGVPVDKIRVVPLAPAEIFKPMHGDPRVEEARQRFVGADTPFFLNVGKLSARRNLPKIIEAFARFKKSTKLPHKLVVVGENYLNLPLEDLAVELGIANDLIHPEWVSDQYLVFLYNGAEAFVVAPTYESVSLTTLEAQATGTPVIIPDLAGLREMTGDFALVIRRAGVTEIAEAMTRIATDSALRRRLVEQGLEYASGFSWERTARETLAVLEEAGQMRAPSVHERASVAI